MTKKKVSTLAEIDGTEKGKVQLMSIKLVEGFDEDPKMMHTYFEEEEGKADPWLRAEGLKESIKGDWPEHYWAIVGNSRAQYLKWRRHMLNMGLFEEENLGPQDYLDCAK